MQQARGDERRVLALCRLGEQLRDLGQMIEIGLATPPLAALIGMAFGGELGRPRHQTGCLGGHLIGSCTVTSLVPSGNVASTWMSWIISAMPGITWARV